MITTKLESTLAGQIKDLARRFVGNEKAFQAAVEEQIASLRDALGLPVARPWERLGRLECDVVHGHVVIEYEAPGKFRVQSGRNEAIRQLVEDYLPNLDTPGRDVSERVGVALDGEQVAFVHWRDGAWQTTEFRPVDEHTVKRLLMLIRANNRRRLVPVELVRDFGPQSDIARDLVTHLYQAIIGADHPRVQVLSAEWRRSYGAAYGSSEEFSRQIGTKAEVLLRTFDLGIPDLEPELLFYCVHTYYAFVIKMLAAELVSIHRSSVGNSFLLSTNNANLLDRLRYLESGELFSQAGIGNFLEGDFFGWFLDVWSGGLQDATWRVLERLAEYDIATLTLHPEETQDLLKELYQGLVHEEIRRPLGEYYTPNWLAELLVDEIGYSGQPSTRLLDPACGSGTFLVTALKKLLHRWYSEHPDATPTEKEQLLSTIQQNIVGFDLNPVAVIAARANYLLAVGELLEYTERFDVPVYLADSVFAPSRLAAGDFSFETSVGTFTIPAAVVTEQKVDQFFSLVERSVDDLACTPEIFLEKVTFALGEHVTKSGVDAEQITELFSTLRRLHDEERNRIWARVLRNSLAPSLRADRDSGLQFDFVVGNPPWVRWERLAPSLRDLEKNRGWSRYGLFRFARGRVGMQPEPDLAMFFVYACAELYLCAQGRLLFTIPQSVFQATNTAAKAFRQFKIPDVGIELKVSRVHDFSSFPVFDNVVNRPAALLIEKGKPTEYPVEYISWTKDAGVSVEYGYSWSQVSKVLKAMQYMADTMNSDVTSPWMVGPAAILPLLHRLKNPHQAGSLKGRKGTSTEGGNRVLWVRVLHDFGDGQRIRVENCYDSPIKNPLYDAEPHQAVIDVDLVYPLVRGRDIQRWKADYQGRYIILPHGKFNEDNSTELQTRFSRTWEYLSHFKQVLQQRSTIRHHRMPWYGVWNHGPYSYAPYKVVWREMARELTAAVLEDVGGKCLVPDHKLMMVPFENRLEAHYVAALLNSTPVRVFVKAYAVETQTSTHVVEFLHLPSFDENNPLHCQLAELSMLAHKAATDGEPTSELERAIDDAVAFVWDLSAAEIRQLQERAREIGLLAHATEADEVDE